VLFGHPAGVIVATEIEAMSLPSYKRRALVMVAAELVSNSLLHAFHGRRTGLIEVSLTVHRTGSASLRVADDGIGFIGMRPNLGCGVAACLAGLLESDLAYDRKAGRTIAEIAFPLCGSWSGRRSAYRSWELERRVLFGKTTTERARVDLRIERWSSSRD
jgi:two-component sensor histidine kinase